MLGVLSASEREKRREGLLDCATRFFEALAERVRQDVERFNESENAPGVQGVYSVVEGNVFSVRRDNHDSKTFVKFTLSGVTI